MAKAARALPDPEEEPEVFGFFEAAVDALGGLADEEEAAAYAPERVPEAAGEPPVDFDATVDGILWVAVLALRSTATGRRSGPPCSTARPCRRST